MTILAFRILSLLFSLDFLLNDYDTFVELLFSSPNLILGEQLYIPLHGW